MSWALVVAGCADDGIGRASVFPRPAPDRSVVAIRATGCRRTSTKSVGVVIAPSLVATVAHSVAGEREIDVRLPDGTTLRGAVAAIDVELDLALLRVEGLGLAAVPLAEPTTGDATFVDDPEGSAISDPVVIRRLVGVRTSDIYRQGAFVRPGFELGEASVEPGDSGGGVFQGGALVGIVWGTSRLDGERAWATAAAEYERLVAAASSAVAVPAVACTR